MSYFTFVNFWNLENVYLIVDLTAVNSIVHFENNKKYQIVFNVILSIEKRILCRVIQGYRIIFEI